jgi:hypothetical protein
MSEEHMSRAFENRELRKTFGRKWEKAAGDRRKLHNEELRDLYWQRLLG